nr:MAG TPA: hypothetical protein [Caudoviricetes sp.]
MPPLVASDSRNQRRRTCRRRADDRRSAPCAGQGIGCDQQRRRQAYQ